MHRFSSIRSWINSYAHAQKIIEKYILPIFVNISFFTITLSLPQDYEQEFRGFKKLFLRFLSDPASSVEWDKIQKLPEGSVSQIQLYVFLHLVIHECCFSVQVCDYASLPTPPTESIRSMLDKLVVIKLNGGLGTSMGCQGPKSVIPVRNDLTFLDLTVQQIEVTDD